MSAKIADDPTARLSIAAPKAQPDACGVASLVGTQLAAFESAGATVVSSAARPALVLQTAVRGRLRATGGRWKVSTE